MPISMLVKTKSFNGCFDIGHALTRLTRLADLCWIGLAGVVQKTSLRLLFVLDCLHCRELDQKLLEIGLLRLPRVSEGLVHHHRRNTSWCHQRQHQP
jgi:hypothetical protein